MNIWNKTLNPAAQLDHSAGSLSEMALKSILWIYHLAAIAVEESLDGCAWIDHLLGLGMVQDGGGGRNLPRNVRGLLAEHKLILCDLRWLDHLEGNFKDTWARMSWAWRVDECLCDACEGGVGCHDVDGLVVYERAVKLWRNDYILLRVLTLGWGWLGRAIIIFI